MINTVAVEMLKVVVVAIPSVLFGRESAKASVKKEADKQLATMMSLMQQLLHSGTKVSSSYEHLIKCKDSIIKALKRDNKHLKETCDDLQDLVEEDGANASDDLDEDDNTVMVSSGPRIESAVGCELVPGSPAANVALELYAKIQDAREILDSMSDRLSPHDLELLRASLIAGEAN